MAKLKRGLLRERVIVKFVAARVLAVDREEKFGLAVGVKVAGIDQAEPFAQQARFA